MAVRFYWAAVSHPSQAVRTMLDLKRVPYDTVNVLPFNQRIHLRLVGFRGGTVPAVKLDGRRLQGSREIARALDELWPEPPLFPADPAERQRVEDAERWGEQQFQPVPRRLGRWGAAREFEVRRWGARSARLPAPELVARVSAPPARYFARTIEVDGRRARTDAEARSDLESVPALLDRADALLADGTLTLDPPNAATLQVLSSVALLNAFADLYEVIGGRPSVVAARELFPRYPGPIPGFLPREWVEPIVAELRGGRAAA
jgi:glutathione S-transferase